MKETNFGVEAGAILLELEGQFNAGPECSPGIVMGCGLIRHSLARIAKYAVKTNDEFLIKEMLHLGALKPD